MEISLFRQWTFLAVTLLILLNGVILSLLSFKKEHVCSPCTSEEMKRKQTMQDLRILAIVSYCIGGIMLLTGIAIMCFYRIIKPKCKQSHTNAAFEDNHGISTTENRYRAPSPPPSYQEVLRMTKPAIITGSTYCIPQEDPPLYNSVFFARDTIDDSNQGWQIQLITLRTDLSSPVVDSPPSNTSNEVIGPNEVLEV